MVYNMKSRKEEIFAALLEAQKQLKESGVMVMTPDNEVKQKNEELAVEKADIAVSEKLLSTELLEKYMAVKEATQVKTKELNELYEVGEELQQILVAKNAHEALKYKWKNEEENIEQEHQLKIDRFKKECENTLEAISNEVKEKEARIQKEREIEKEEYNYNLQKLHKRDSENWEEIKAKRIKELTEKENGIAAKEKAMEEQEQYVEELKQKVENIPELIENERKVAFEVGKADAGRSYGFEKRAIETEYSHKLEMSEARETALQESNKELKEVNSTLTEKLDRAYSELRDLASKVAENGGVKVVNSNDTNKK